MGLLDSWLVEYEQLREQADEQGLKVFFNKFLDCLENGHLRLAHPSQGDWVIEPIIQILINAYFTHTSFQEDLSDAYFWDKVPRQKIRHARCASGAIVRRGAYIAPGAVLMPSFVNIGASVGAQTMIDAWATVGSCAQIGARCHLSGGSGLGGVLEPPGARPVIIEDDCFIGARSEIAEGVIVRHGSVIASGVFLTQSTKIYDRQTGAITYGEVPAWSVVVPGTLPSSDGTHLAAAIIVKKRDAGTSQKVSLNQALRDHAPA